jgi:hypothetical protein
MSEPIPRKVGSHGKALSKQAIGQSVKQGSQYFHQQALGIPLNL